MNSETAATLAKMTVYLTIAFVGIFLVLGAFRIHPGLGVFTILVIVAGALGLYAQDAKAKLEERDE